MKAEAISYHLICGNKVTKETKQHADHHSNYEAAAPLIPSSLVTLRSPVTSYIRHHPKQGNVLPDFTATLELDCVRILFFCFVSIIVYEK